MELHSALFPWSTTKLLGPRSEMRVRACDQATPIQAHHSILLPPAVPPLPPNVSPQICLCLSS